MSRRFDDRVVVIIGAGSAQARAELANPGQALKIGMFVNVAFAALGGAEASTPLIPKSAVQNINNQQVVFAKPRHRIHLQCGR